MAGELGKIDYLAIWATLAHCRLGETLVLEKTYVDSIPALCWENTCFMLGQTLLSKLFPNYSILILGNSLLCLVIIVVLHQSFTSHVYSVFLGQLDLTRGWP